MDVAVVNALKRWPNVPDCHGWLALDGFGRWRMASTDDQFAQQAALGLPLGDVIHHAGLCAFIARNYAQDEVTRHYYFQNGPQRVWVTLATAPYVLRYADAIGEDLIDQCGRAWTEFTACELRSDGAVWLSRKNAQGCDWACLLGADLERWVEELSETGQSVLIESQELQKSERLSQQSKQVIAWRGLTVQV